MNVVSLLTEIYDAGFAPEWILSDNGGEFVSKIFKSLHTKFNSGIKHGMPYKPSTQGAIERRNGVLKACIGKILAQKGVNPSSITLKELQTALQEALAAINHEVNSATKFIPHELFHKRTDNSFYPHPGNFRR